MTFATVHRPSRRGSSRARPSSLPSDPSLGILETKLAPPYRRPGVVPRPRIVERLSSIETPAIVITAPAGYGKSIALAQWADADARPVAWLSIDDRDRDPAVLLRGIAAALHRLAPLDRASLDALIAPGGSVWTTAVPRLGAAIARRGPSIIVLDDLDRLDDDAVALVIGVMELLPAGWQIALAGRSGGRFPVARLAARGQLTRLGRDELALDPIETGRVAAASGIKLDGSDVRDLLARTEGWAAGVYLAALATRERRTLSASGSPEAPDRLIEEYFRSELLGALAPADADLLLYSSVLERVNGSLCDTLLGRTGSGSALDRLERENLFVIALDRDRTWFRYHHLLSDVLRAELARRDPGATARILRRAAAWHEDHDLIDQAIELAIEGQDEDTAARALWRLAGSDFAATRWETIRRWFTWFEQRDAGDRHPKLAAFAALVSAMNGDAAGADRWATIADRHPETSERGSDAAFVAVSRAILARHGMTAMAADVELAERLTDERDPWRGAAVFMLGISNLLRGDSASAERWLTEAAARATEGREISTAAALAHAHLGVLALDQGDRIAAETHARQARAIVAAGGFGEQGPAASVDALSARIAMLHGATDQARADVTHAQRLRPLLTYALPWVAIRARLDLIRVQIALADGGGARTLLGEIRDILAHRPDLGTLIDEAAELEDRVKALRGGIVGASTLTLAELRLLPLLTTHLSFREIGARLFVSQNTVKTQAISIYRKLDATSRAEAIDRAVAIGLLDGGPASEPFIPSG